MIPLGPVVARARVRAQRATVWNYLADPALRASWWPEVHLDTELGGSVTEKWAESTGESAIGRDAAGEVDVFVNGHALGFRWSDVGDTATTAVLFTLRAHGVDTGVTVTETGFDALPMAAERAAASTEGWQSLLADLVTAVDAAGDTGAAGNEQEDAPTVVLAAVPEQTSEPEPDLEPEPEPILELKPEPEPESKSEPEMAPEPEPLVVSESGSAEEYPEESTVPLVLPGPPSETPRDEPDDDSLTGDPDFDALIRGDSVE